MSIINYNILMWVVEYYIFALEYSLDEEFETVNDVWVVVMDLNLMKNYLISLVVNLYFLYQ